MDTVEPQLAPNPLLHLPLVLIEAWNEFGENRSDTLPTVSDGNSYGAALATMVLEPQYEQIGTADGCILFVSSCFESLCVTWSVDA